MSYLEMAIEWGKSKGWGLHSHPAWFWNQLEFGTAIRNLSETSWDVE